MYAFHKSVNGNTLVSVYFLLNSISWGQIWGKLNSFVDWPADKSLIGTIGLIKNVANQFRVEINVTNEQEIGYHVHEIKKNVLGAW